jgi:uncharacterized protein (DUF736 family)
MIIGIFRKSGDGYVGRLRSLTLDVDLALVPAQMLDNDNAPAWRLFLGSEGEGAEIGAGWNRVGEVAGAYISVKIDDPALAEPMRADLLHSGQKGDERYVLWSHFPVRERN